MQKLVVKPRCAGKPRILSKVATVLVLLPLVPLAGCQKAPGPSKQGVEQKGGTAIPGTGLPRLVDLGAGKCIPCKMMAPILEELKKEYSGSLEVVFIDVWEDRAAGSKYGIENIPTQIFFDPSGKELFRHEGFFAKEDILAKWKELGIELPRKPSEPMPKT